MAGLQQTLHWTPRVLAILFAVFISLFALDVFEGGERLSKMLLGFAIHMIPTAILVAALLVAWRWPGAGGLAYIALAVGFAATTRGHSGGQTLLLISGPPLLAGLLFVADHFVHAKAGPVAVDGGV